MRAKIVVLLLGLAACGGGEDEGAEARPDTESVAAAPRIEPLTDAEALGILMAASSGMAEAARAPVDQIVAPELRRLVNVIRADHTALQRELTEIADSLQLTPSEHAAASRVRAATQQALTEAAQLEWGSADAAVVQQQLNLSELLLAVLDSTVLPGLQPSLLRQYAEATRPTVAAHLQRAQQVEILLRNRVAATPRRVEPTLPSPPVDTAPPAVPKPDTGRVR